MSDENAELPACPDCGGETLPIGPGWVRCRDCGLSFPEDEDQPDTLPVYAEGGSCPTCGGETESIGGDDEQVERCLSCGIAFEVAHPRDGPDFDNDDSDDDVDVRVEDQGTVVLFELLTEAARDWVSRMVELESWMWLGRNAFAVEHGYSDALIQGMSDDGLTVELS